MKQRRRVFDTPTFHGSCVMFDVHNMHKWNNCIDIPSKNEPHADGIQWVSRATDIVKRQFRPTGLIAVFGRVFDKSISGTPFLLNILSNSLYAVLNQFLNKETYVTILDIAQHIFVCSV